jgi:plastocyanin
MRSTWHSLVFLVLTSAMSVPACAETIQVRIDKMEYSPAEVKAKVGDTVEWINADVLAHTATVKGDWEVVIPTKKTGKAVMKKAGAVDYYCRFHPNMKGRVVVLE